ncbi:MFS transporter [Effusibacillus lacus]|uniref:MFS transporter n=1 Tax=Effusibacillus lacus TaxID=1348429 RepID=A0A292YQP1_9BACL|nr:nitrate/nitrite transporter [Effusibacillus lacus]TCS76898.1 NNP family nitrate/nitrite transporter-like MFS transporter [Effusibacillus lacus]GAX91229.1 MFS transporter [Effusibacillus lacus]
METKGRVSALAFSTVAMIMSFTVWAVISPLANQLQDIYGLTATEKSILVATPILLGSLLRIPMGILADRLGGKKLYALTMLFLTVPLIGAGFSKSYGMLLFWSLFIGLAGTTFAIAIAYVSRWYPPEKQGLVLGITGMGNFGTAVAGFTIPTIANLFGISWAFWGLAIAIAVTAALFWTGTRELPRPKVGKTFRSAFSVIRYKKTWVLSLFYFLTFGAFVSFGIYLPVLLQDLFGLTSVDAGFRAAGFVVVATLMRPVGGYLADRLGAGRILMYVFTGILVGAFLLSFFADNLFLFTVGCLGIALLAGAGNGAIFKLVPEVAPVNTGAVTGIVGAAGGIGGFFPPILLGAVKDVTGAYFFGFLLLGAYALICLVVNAVEFQGPQIRSMKWTAGRKKIKGK